jgi:hypothetical protein
MITIYTASFKHMISSRFLSWTLRFDLINSSFSIMMVSWIYTTELTQSYSSGHTRYSLHSLMNNLWINPWITFWSSHNLLHYLFLHPWIQHIVQALSMDKSYNHHLMQPLVHRDCHQLPKITHGGSICSFTDGSLYELFSSYSDISWWILSNTVHAYD